MTLKAHKIEIQYVPFIGSSIPFVGGIYSSVIPFIRKYIPFVYFRNSTSGFTLIELIVTLTIVGVLAAFAIPGMTTFIKNQRITTQANDLVADLSFARSEAIKRGGGVGICAAVAGGGACSGTADYTNGRLIFADADNSGTFTAGDQILRERPRLEGTPNALMALGGDIDPIIFAARGVVAAGAPTDFAVCDDRGFALGRRIQFGTTGQPRTLNSASCT
jgi:type IV fimbrial biogenesis protein FimT